MTGADKAGFASVLQLMETTLQGYYHNRKSAPEDADASRMRFAGQKQMVEALFRPEIKGRVLEDLRRAGLKVPHCGRKTSEGYEGWDSDMDLDFE
jgi:hypothetical protein